MSNLKTWVPKKGEIKREWLLIDAKDKTLGRLASRIALILQGKHKPVYTPFVLSGDYVVVINARHIRLSGNKAEKKTYAKYTGFPSGRKVITFKDLFAKDPTRILYLAVKGMLPNNNLAKDMIGSLKIYPDAEHRQVGQKPRSIEV